jgi:DNA-binding winged helix-turn-helix (wHTH) protein
MFILLYDVTSVILAGGFEVRRHITWQFGVFSYSNTTGELRKDGTLLRLQEQPRRILERLLEHPGEVVTRQELQDELWPSGVNVDFDISLNAAVRRLRQVLSDDAGQARYIETLPRKGYRFIAPLERVEPLVPQSAATPVAVVRTASFRWWIVAGSTLVLASLAWVIATKRPATIGLVAHASILVPPPQSLAVANGRNVAVSGDGQTIAFIASEKGDRYIYRRALSEPKAEIVAGTEDADCVLFLSNPASMVWASNRGLFQLSGTGVRSLLSWREAQPVADCRGTPAGDILFTRAELLPGSATSGLAGSPWILHRGAHAPERLPTRYSGPGLEVHIPQQLVDGRYLLFSSNRGALDRSVDILDLQTGRQKMLVSPAMGGWLLPADKLLYFWNGEILEAPFDRTNLTLSAPGVPVLSGVSAAGWTGPNADIASNGTLVYATAPPRPDARLVWVDLEGRESPVPVPAGPLRVADVSSDAHHLLLFRDTGPETGKLLDYDLKTGATRELVSDVDRRACWSPDAQTVVYSKTEPGEPLPTLHLFHLASNQSERKLPFAGVGQFGVQWAGSSGQIIFSTGFHPKTQIDIWSVLARTGAPPVRLAVQPGLQMQPRVSPDGKWLAYVNGDLPGTIVIRSLEPAPTSLEIPGPGAAPVWSGDGRWLYYRSGRRFMAAPFNAGASPHIGAPRVLFEGDYLQPGNWEANTFFDTQSKRFLLSIREHDEEVPSHIEVVTNWLQEISRR